MSFRQSIGVVLISYTKYLTLPYLNSNEGYLGNISVPPALKLHKLYTSKNPCIKDSLSQSMSFKGAVQKFLSLNSFRRIIFPPNYFCRSRSLPTSTPQSLPPTSPIPVSFLTATITITIAKPPRCVGSSSELFRVTRRVRVREWVAARGRTEERHRQCYSISLVIQIALDFFHSRWVRRHLLQFPHASHIREWVVILRAILCMSI